MAERARARTHLHVALDEVEGGDGHVGEAAAEDSAGGAGGVVGGGEQRYLALARRRDQEARPRRGG